MTSVSFNWKHFCRSTEGAIALLTAIVLPVVVVLCAIGVDLASLNLQRRKDQAIVDLAAMNAANNLAIADEAALATITANRVDQIKSLKVVKGSYTADPTVSPQNRFKPGVTPYNAVKLTLVTPGTMHFAYAFTKNAPDLVTTAIASTSAIATFSLGTRLAALRGGILNQILGDLIGTNINLSIMDYQALADARIRLDDFLGGTASAANLKAATFSDVMTSSVNLGQILEATANVANTNGNASAAADIRSLLGGGNIPLIVPLNQLIDVGPFASAALGQQTPGLGGTVSALDLIQAAAAIADGRHEVSFSFAAGLPGLGQINASLVIGEPLQHSAWVTVGSQGATITTSQMKLRLIAQVLGSGTLASLNVRLPVYLELAYAKGTLSNITCGANDAGSVDIAVQPGIGRIAIADVTDAELKNTSTNFPLSRGTVISSPLLSATATSVIALQNVDPTTLTFSQSDIDNGIVKTVSTSQPLQSAVSSLLQSSQLSVSALGVGLGTPSAPQLKALLAPAAASLDQIVYELITTLGVSLGEADVSVEGVDCRGSNLSG